jgi:chorismate mutase
MTTLKKESKILPIETWLPSIGKPLIISGPCSAESREQVMATAQQLQKTGIVSAFRAGIWKPRTKPNTFEGHGEVALEWLQEVKELYKFPLAVEVATPAHIEICLKHGIDIFWIGARTGVNPFSMKELAEVLKGIDIPIMVKNPLSPDLALWAGNIERFLLNGNTKIAAIHRGFNTYEKTKYRNFPLWNLAVELKTMIPGLPVICDPSHIAGKRELLQEISQHALYLDMDGLMLETHCDPDNALTDAAQQITPDALKEMVGQLKILTPDENNPSHELEMLRKQIDELDSQLFRTIASRLAIVKDIAHIKKNHKMTIVQLTRWNQILQNRVNEGMEMGLNENFVRDFLAMIHKESIELQSKILE